MIFRFCLFRIFWFSSTNLVEEKSTYLIILSISFYVSNKIPVLYVILLETNSLLTRAKTFL